jgi:peptidoglycan hydrolase-like protein with peptidoglycan-binding domain
LPYAGVPLRVGSESEEVLLLQQYLNAIGEVYPEIPGINPTGYFGPRTQEAVIAFQELSGITPTGVVAAVTWTAIAALYDAITRGAELQSGQYPGFSVGA